MDKVILAEEFIHGKILLLNKPLYWTSFDLVRKVKVLLQKKLGIPKLKVGHAGTLDPLATGLMILCTGKETRNIEQYQAQNKEYIARITLGATTPSFDLETPIDSTYPTDHITIKSLKSVLHEMTGIQMQNPPVYSARFVEGKRAYSLARKGRTVELTPREINISTLELLGYENPVMEIRVRCSKGTYVRALARDIGQKLGSGAYLSGLIRVAIGDFLLTDAINIEDFERNLIVL